MAQFEITGNKENSKSATRNLIRKYFMVNENKYFYANLNKSTENAKNLVIDLLKSEAIKDLKIHKIKKEEKTQKTLAELKSELSQKSINRIYAQFKNYFFQNYRSAHSAWVIISNDLILKLANTPSVKTKISTQWSKNGKWRANSSDFEIAISPNWKKEVLEKGIACIDGLMTTHAKETGKGIFEASWIEQGRGFELRVMNGFICKIGNEFYHGKSIEDCTKIAKKRNTQNFLIETETKLKNLNTAELIFLHGNTIAYKSDSKRAGNCESGTNSWIEKNLPGREKATVKEILTLDPNNRLVLAAARVAILRNLKKGGK